MVPLMDKNDAGRRSHYLTIQFSISDAPRDDEIVIVLGAWMHTQNAGRQIHSFMRYNGNLVRATRQAIAPLIAPAAPALVAGFATLGQGAASYSSLRDSLDRAAGV